MRYIHLQYTVVMRVCSLLYRARTGDPRHSSIFVIYVCNVELMACLAGSDSYKQRTRHPPLSTRNLHALAANKRLLATKFSFNVFNTTTNTRQASRLGFPGAAVSDNATIDHTRRRLASRLFATFLHVANETLAHVTSQWTKLSSLSS